MKRALLLLFMLLVGVGLYYWLPIEPRWNYVQEDCPTAFYVRNSAIRDGIVRIARTDRSVKFLDAIDGHDVGSELCDAPLMELTQSPNGRYLVGLVRTTGEYRSLDRQTGVRRTFDIPKDGEDRFPDFTWSPKGAWLVCREHKDEWLIRIADGTIHGKWSHCTLWTPRILGSFDASENFYVGVLHDEHLGAKAVVWDLMESRVRYQSNWAKVTNVAISPNGRWLLTSQVHGPEKFQTDLHDLHSNNATSQLTKDFTFSASFSLDGSRLERRPSCTFPHPVDSQLPEKREVWDVVSRKLLATHPSGNPYESDILDGDLSRRFKRSKGPSVVCLDATSNQAHWDVCLSFEPIWLESHPGDRNILLVSGWHEVAAIDADSGALVDLPGLNRAGWLSSFFFDALATNTRRVGLSQVQVQQHPWLTWLLGESEYSSLRLRAFDLQGLKEVVPGGIRTWPKLFAITHMPIWMSPNSPHLAVCVPIGDSSFWIAGYDLEARPWARILCLTLFAGAVVCLIGRLVAKKRRHHSHQPDAQARQPANLAGASG